ncbi:AraC family transcriptional regulator [Paenibacillus sp. N1-5-1-14]|uniref:helix-turn-helix transcriptional regulator n=1 Tax=Paenibacillus radicibacter TaxID=2972488 RepID=UPI002158C408|nr:AraC family transcriptional regulator [Paenibacillus radicibacter]MCR8643069.1 AraC family transcriptional regulator [Paenibacillus radicibacter]
MDNLFILDNLYSAIRLPGIEYAKQLAGWTYPNHRHPFFEYIVCVEGVIHQWVSGQLYVLYPGDGIIIGSDMFHQMEMMEDCSFFVFHFDVEQSDIHAIFQMSAHPIIRHAEYPELYERVRQFLTAYGEHLRLISRGSPLSNKVLSSQHDIRVQMEHSIKLLHIHSSLLELVGMLASWFLQAKEGQLTLAQVKPSQLKLAREAAYWIEEHLLDEVRMSLLAKHLNVHRTHLHHCFKSVYGTSPSDFLRHVRIREAKLLLTTTDWSMEKIALTLRFSSSAHFSRAFRSVVGMPPLQFRQHAKEK